MRSRSALSLFDSTLTPSTLPPAPPSNGAALKPSGPPAPPPPKDPRPFKPAGPDDGAEESKHPAAPWRPTHIDDKPAPVVRAQNWEFSGGAFKPSGPEHVVDMTPPDVRADIDRIAAALVADGTLTLDPVTGEYRPTRRRRWRFETDEERAWRLES